MWPMLAVAGGTALLGAYTQNQQAKAQARQQAAEMNANAAQTQYSPWTGASIRTVGSNAPDVGASTINGALQGGLAGAMMGSQFEQMSAQKPTAQPGAMNVNANANYNGELMAGGPHDNMGVWNQMRKPNLYGNLA